MKKEKNMRQKELKNMRDLSEVEIRQISGGVCGDGTDILHPFPFPRPFPWPLPFPDPFPSPYPGPTIPFPRI